MNDNGSSVSPYDDPDTKYYEKDVHGYAAEHNLEKLKELINADNGLATELHPYTKRNPLMDAIRPYADTKRETPGIVHLFLKDEQRRACIDYLMQFSGAVSYHGAKPKEDDTLNNGIEVLVDSAVAYAIKAWDFETARKLVEEGAPVIYTTREADIHLLYHIFFEFSRAMREMENVEGVNKILKDAPNYEQDVTEEEIESAKAKLKDDTLKLIDAIHLRDSKAIFGKRNIRSVDCFMHAINLCDVYSTPIVEHLINIAEDDEFNPLYRDEQGDSVFTVALQSSIIGGYDNRLLLAILLRANPEILTNIFKYEPGRELQIRLIHFYENYTFKDGTILDYAKHIQESLPKHIQDKTNEPKLKEKEKLLDLILKSSSNITELMQLLGNSDAIKSLDCAFKKALLQVETSENAHLATDYARALKSALLESNEFDKSLLEEYSQYIDDFVRLLTCEDHTKLEPLSYLEGAERDHFDSFLKPLDLINTDSVTLKFLHVLKKGLSTFSESVEDCIQREKRTIFVLTKNMKYADIQVKFLEECVKNYSEGHLEIFLKDYVKSHAGKEQEKGSPSQVLEGASASEESKAVSACL